MSESDGPGPLPWEENLPYKLGEQKKSPKFGVYHRIDWLVNDLPKDLFKEMWQEAKVRGWLGSKNYYLHRVDPDSRGVLWISEKILEEFHTLMRQLLEKYKEYIDKEAKEFEEFITS